MKPPTPPASFAAATFEAAEEQRLDASLAATVSQRLRWLEEALAFAARMGALDERLQHAGDEARSGGRRRFKVEN